MDTWMSELSPRPDAHLKPSMIPSSIHACTCRASYDHVVRVLRLLHPERLHDTQRLHVHAWSVETYTLPTVQGTTTCAAGTFGACWNTRASGNWTTTAAWIPTRGSKRRSVAVTIVRIRRQFHAQAQIAHAPVFCLAAGVHPSSDIPVLQLLYAPPSFLQCGGGPAFKCPALGQRMM